MTNVIATVTCRMKIIYVCLFGILNILENTATEDVCSSDKLPVVKVCMGGAAMGQSVLMDFSEADVNRFSECLCTASIYAGNTLSLQEVSAPGYIQCGSSITVRDDTGDIKYRIDCYGQADIKSLEPGHSLSVVLTRHFQEANAKYCYQLNIAGGKSPSMQVTCNKYTTSTSTTTTVSTTTREQTTSNLSGLIAAANKDPKTCGQDECNNIIVVVLASFLGIMLVYSVAVTTFIIRRCKPKSEPSMTKDEMYEEIPPPSSYVPVYNPSIASRPLPNPSVQSGKWMDNNRTMFRTASPSHWNNTYESVEDKVGGTTIVNQRF